MTTNISIYDISTLIGVVDGEPKTAWSTAREVVNRLAHDAGRARSDASLRGWCRPKGRQCYQRSGFRAVNTFRADRNGGRS